MISFLSMDWQGWIGLFLVLLILEILFSGFILACIALGCLMAGLAGLIWQSLPIQLVIFSLTNLIGFIFLRPFLLKFVLQKKNEIKTNASALIGKIGVVSELIDNKNVTGRVKIDGDDWRAQHFSDELIQVNEPIEVLAVKSTVLLVKKTNL